MMIGEGVVLPGVVVKILETDVREIVFGGLLGTDHVETEELCGRVAIGLDATNIFPQTKKRGSPNCQ